MQKITVVYDKHHTLHQPLTYPSAVGLEEYPEKPARVESIYKTIQNEPFCEIISPDQVDLSLLSEIHTKEYLSFISSLEHKLTDDAYYYPTQVFRDSPKPHHNLFAELGSFSFDLSAPVDRNIYKQALISASCAYTAASSLIKKTSLAYSLSRPPGHHAMRGKMGGFCYINNSALGAQYLSRHGKVAVLDIDYHHGNGTQDIFYDRSDVLTVSIHADPSTDYPYYWGSADETGEGKGKGFNKNYPLKQGTTPDTYHHTLLNAVQLIHDYKPQFLVIPFGLDTYEKDALGTFKLTTEYYQKIAETIKTIAVPTLIIQEGGYYIEDLGANAVSFLRGFI